MAAGDLMFRLILCRNWYYLCLYVLRFGGQFPVSKLVLFMAVCFKIRWTISGVVTGAIYGLRF